MSVKLLFNDFAQQVDANGDPYSGALLFVYIAGTSTKAATYQDDAGSTPHSNPIIFDASGRLPGALWVTAGATYKLVFAPSNDTDPPASPIWTIDDVSGINDTTITPNDQWIVGTTPTYIAATQFSVTGDQTSTYHVGRRVKLTDAGGTKYGTISAVAFGAVTTITIVGDALATPTTALSYGLQSAENHSTPLLTDAFPIVSGSADKTKKLRFEVDGFTAATTRVITVQDSDDTLVGRATTDTLSNKTLTAPALNGAITGDSIAAQAEMETGTAVDSIVSPGRMHFHPCFPKCFAMVTVAAGTPTLAASHNITSITDTAIGRLTITIATDFSSANWCCIPGIAAANIANGLHTVAIDNGSLAAGSVLLECWSFDVAGAAGALADPESWHMTGFGDQA